MSTRVIDLAARLERLDELHEARLLLLLKVAAGTSPIDGIMKLAKMDFLLRYPNALDRTLSAIADKKPTATRVALKIPEEQKNTIEGRMVRFRFGPWDKRYRRWLSILSAKGLVSVSRTGRTVKISLTETGSSVATVLCERPEFKELAERADIVRFAVGDMSATRLMRLVYEIAPEIVGLKWGSAIKL